MQSPEQTVAHFLLCVRRQLFSRTDLAKVGMRAVEQPRLEIRNELVATRFARLQELWFLARNLALSNFLRDNSL